VPVHEAAEGGEAEELKDFAGGVKFQVEVERVDPFDLNVADLAEHLIVD
jgi:hypothetical protein